MPTTAKQCRWLVQMEPNWVMNFTHLNSHGLRLRGGTTFLPKVYFGLLSGSYIEMIKILETHCVPNLSKFIKGIFVLNMEPHSYSFFLGKLIIHTLIEIIYIFFHIFYVQKSNY